MRAYVWIRSLFRSLFRKAELDRDQVLAMADDDLSSGAGGAAGAPLHAEAQRHDDDRFHDVPLSAADLQPHAPAARGSGLGAAQRFLSCSMPLS